jgi:hypothetical protein
MRGLHHRTALALGAALLAASASAAGPFDELLRRVPDSANAILYANVRALENSPVGRQKNWAEKVRKDFQGGLTNLPPTAERKVVAQRIDPRTLQADWRIELVQTNQPLQAERCAQRVGGSLDKLGGLTVILAPRGSYFVQFGTHVAAEAFPADRQKLSRWISYCEKATRPVVSQYLQEAALDANGTTIVFAVDLQDVFDLPGIQHAIKGLKSLSDRRVDKDVVALTLSGVRGLQLRVTADRDLQGEIRLDVSDSAEPLRLVAKEFLTEVMSKMGASVDDVDRWKASVEDRAIVLSGPLTERGARMLLSPAENRISGPVYAELDRGGAAGSPDAKATATLRYYRSLKQLLDELNTAKDTRKLSDRTYWYQQYASKIESLPMLNVDDEMLQLGAQIAATVRQLANLASSTKTTGQRINAQTVTGSVVVPVTYGASGYAYGPYGGGYGGGWNYTVPQLQDYNNYRQVANLASGVAAGEKALREQTWTNIDNALNAMRKKMVDKYKIEF